MGSNQSQPSFTKPRYTSLEEGKAPSPPGAVAAAETAAPQQLPAGITTAQKGDAPPQLAKVESFSEKFVRKFTSQPLVPLGCIATAYFLGSGIKSFKDRDPIRSQKMMRARVGAQFVTLVIFMGYLGKESLDFRLAPAYQDKKKRDQERMAAQQQQ